MSKRNVRGKGKGKGSGKGKGGGNRSHRHDERPWDGGDEWDDEPASWSRMSRDERADLRDFLDERAKKRSHDDERAMFRRWQRYQEQAEDYGEHGDANDGYYSADQGEYDGCEHPSGSKQKQRKDRKLRKMHENVDNLETALHRSKQETTRLSMELEQLKKYTLAKFEKADKKGEKADDPSAMIQVSKAEWDDMQKEAARYAKEQTPDKPLLKSALKGQSGQSQKALQFVFNYDEAPDDTSTADSAASSITDALKEKLQLADETRALKEGEYKVSPANRNTAERLARQMAKHFDESDYEALDAIRKEFGMKTSASKTTTLLEAMLKAIVNRKVQFEPSELLPGDT